MAAGGGKNIAAAFADSPECLFSPAWIHGVVPALIRQGSGDSLKHIVWPLPRLMVAQGFRLVCDRAAREWVSA